MKEVKARIHTMRRTRLNVAPGFDDNEVTMTFKIHEGPSQFLDRLVTTKLSVDQLATMLPTEFLLRLFAALEEITSAQETKERQL